MEDLKYHKGTVVSNYYSEEGWERGVFAPYQIELDNGRLICAKKDDDRMIRAASESSDEPVAAPNISDDDDATTV